MRHWIMGLVVVLALGIAGCSLLGIKTDPTTGEVTTDGTGGIVGAVGGIVGLPWIGTAAAALAGLYAEYKRRGWKSAALSTFDAVEVFKNTPEGAKVWASLKEKLGEAHADAKVKELVDKALGNT